MAHKPTEAPDRHDMEPAVSFQVNPCQGEAGDDPHVHFDLIDRNGFRFATATVNLKHALEVAERLTEIAEFYLQREGTHGEG